MPTKNESDRSVVVTAGLVEAIAENAGAIHSAEATTEGAVTTENGQPVRMKVLVTKFESVSGFCVTADGQVFYFGLPGYVTGNGRGGFEKGSVQFKIVPGVVIEVVQVRQFTGQPHPAAWNWTHVSLANANHFKRELAEKKAKAESAKVATGITKQASQSATKPQGKVLWHVHTVVSDVLNREEHGWGAVSLIGDSRGFDRFQYKDGDLIGFNTQGYSQFEAGSTTYTPAKLDAFPQKGDQVVVLITKRRMAKKQGSNEMIETDEIIAFRWCLASDFPSGLCTEHCHCDDSTEAVLGTATQAKPNGHQFRIVLSAEFGGSTYTVGSLADVAELIDSMSRKGNPSDKELAIFLGEFCLERQTADSQWEVVTETIEQLILAELRKANVTQPTPTETKAVMA